MPEERNLTIAICDDEKIMLKIIMSAVKSAFEEHFGQLSIHAFLNVKKMDAFLKTEKVDLIFLDIVMPKVDGVEYAEFLRNSGSATPIVFVTGSEERVWDSFRVRPFDFIRKNCFLTDLQRVAERFSAEYKKKESDKASEGLVVSVKGELHTIELSSIKYIESQKRTQLVHFNAEQEPLPINSQMQTLEEELSPHGFYRVHKGFLVNMRRIKLISAEGVFLDDGTRIPCNVRKVTAFKHIYLNFQQKQGIEIHT